MERRGSRWRIASGEFAHAGQQVDLSDEAIEGWLEKASELDDPKIYVTLRYD